MSRGATRLLTHDSIQRVTELGVPNEGLVLPIDEEKNVVVSLQQQQGRLGLCVEMVDDYVRICFASVNDAPYAFPWAFSVQTAFDFVCGRS